MKVAEQPTIKQLEPFSYFLEQASALSGMGGARQAPDPRYCFHSRYEYHLPGIVVFHIRLGRASASYGELTARIHAYRPDSGLDISLAASTQHRLEGMADEDAVIPLRIAAIPGVQYAVYGYLSEPSDLTIHSLEITAEELGGEDAGSYAAAELGTSAFGGTRMAPLRQLVGNEEPSFDTVLSQPFTPAQADAPAFADLAAGLPSKPEGSERIWRAAFALRALERYSYLAPGARGLLLGPTSEVAPLLGAAGCQLLRHGAPENVPPASTIEHWIDAPLAELGDRMTHCDFAVANGVLDGAASHGELIERFNAVLRCLLRGGMGVFLFDYWPNSWGPPSGERFTITETIICRIALHTIGHESGLAQMLLPAIDREDQRNSDAAVPFALIVFR